MDDIASCVLIAIVLCVIDHMPFRPSIRIAAFIVIGLVLIFGYHLVGAGILFVYVLGVSAGIARSKRRGNTHTVRQELRVRVPTAPPPSPESQRRSPMDALHPMRVQPSKPTAQLESSDEDIDVNDLDHDTAVECGLAAENPDDDVDTPDHDAEPPDDGPTPAEKQLMDEGTQAAVELMLNPPVPRQGPVDFKSGRTKRVGGAEVTVGDGFVSMSYTRSS